MHDALALPLQIARHARDAVAVVAGQVGGDQVLADGEKFADTPDYNDEVKRRRKLGIQSVFAALASAACPAES